MEEIKKIFNELYKRKSLIKVLRKDGKNIYGVIKSAPSNDTLILVNDKDSSKLAVINFSDVLSVKEIEKEVNVNGRSQQD